jgi:dynein heavy chain
MNSVMDDNKLLTLPNGERIRLASHVKLLFEVADLQYASPATISRCGMVFVDSRNLGWRPYLWRWLNGRTAPGEADALKALFEKYATPAIDWVVEGVDGDDVVRRPVQAVPVTALNMVTQLCGLLDATLAEAGGDGAGAAAGEEGGVSSRLLDPQVLEGLFIFCCVWSIGACLVQRPEAKERDRFDAFIREIAAMGTIDNDR